MKFNNRIKSSYSSSARVLSSDLLHLLDRLQPDPGFVAMLSGSQLRLLARMDVDRLADLPGTQQRDEKKPTASTGAISKSSLVASRMAAPPPPPAAAAYERCYLEEIQRAAGKYLLQKNEIRDAVGLLKLYQQVKEPYRAQRDKLFGSGQEQNFGFWFETGIRNGIGI
jgi:hypothetical protein